MYSWDISVNSLKTDVHAGCAWSNEKYFLEKQKFIPIDYYPKSIYKSCGGEVASGADEVGGQGAR